MTKTKIQKIIFNFKKEKPEPVALVRALTEAGPGFVELARIASSRSDIMPVIYQNDLLNLSYQLQGLKRGSVQSTLRAELGRADAKDFTSISESVYQVNLLGTTHAGILADHRRVLITVNNRKLSSAFEKNLEHIDELVALECSRMEKSRAHIWQSVIKELKARAELITDLTNSAAKMEILSEQFLSNSKIIIPQVLWEYCTPNLLVQEYRNWPDFSDVGQGKSKVSSASKKYLIRYLLEALAFMYAKGGHFLLRPNLKNWQAGQKNAIVFNNFLSIGYLEPKIRIAFIALLRALLENKPNEAGKALLSMHYQEHDLENHHEAGLSLRSVEGESVSEKLWFCLERAWQGNLAIPLGITMAAESVLYLEHAMRRFDKEVDIPDALLRAIKKL